MRDGLALVLKPAGPTSHDCVAEVRRALGIRRAGHLGTLDPFASGLLVILVGPATRLARLATGWSKAYEGTIRLGVVTDTDDATGAAVAASESWRELTATQVGAALGALQGSRTQVPPAYSAKKVGGRRAYRLARRGEGVTLAPVPVLVHRLELVGWSPPLVQFTALVSSGTYLRSLAREVGEHLGCGGHLASLRRTAVGPFHVEDAVPAEQVTAAILRPLEPLAQGWPRRDLEPAESRAVAHGRSIPAPESEGTVVLFAEGRLVGIGVATGGVLKPRVVLPAA